MSNTSNIPDYMADILGLIPNQEAIIFTRFNLDGDHFNKQSVVFSKIKETEHSEGQFYETILDLFAKDYDWNCKSFADSQYAINSRRTTPDKIKEKLEELLKYNYTYAGKISSVPQQNTDDAEATQPSFFGRPLFRKIDQLESHLVYDLINFNYYRSKHLPAICCEKISAIHGDNLSPTEFSKIFTALNNELDEDSVKFGLQNTTGHGYKVMSAHGEGKVESFYHLYLCRSNNLGGRQYDTYYAHINANEDEAIIPEPLDPLVADDGKEYHFDDLKDFARKVEVLQRLDLLLNAPIEQTDLIPKTFIGRGVREELERLIGEKYPKELEAPVVKKLVNDMFKAVKESR